MSVTLDDILKKRFNRMDSFDVMRWLTSGKTITKTEEISLLSLLAYTAVETDTPIDALQRAFLDSFEIARVEQLRSDDYNQATHFLMTWQGESESDDGEDSLRIA